MRKFLQWLQSPMNFFLGLCSLIPLGLILWNIPATAYPFPVLDQWSSGVPLFGGAYDDGLVDVAIDVQNGTLTVEDLFYQHTAHRIFFSKLITAFLSLTTHWQLKLEIYAIVVFQCVAVIFIVALVRQHRPQFTGVILCIAATLFLAIRLDDTWKTGQITGWTLASVFAMTVIWTLFMFPIRRMVLAAAAILAWCSTFSVLAGMAIWPVGIMALWLRGYRKLSHYALWLGAAVVTIGMYFSGYDFGATGTRGSLFDPTVSVTALRLLAAPFVLNDGRLTNFGIGLSVVGGGLLLLNAWYLWRRRGNTLEIAPWLCLALYAVGGAFLTGLGRFPSGEHQLVRGRYGTMINYFWLSLIILMILTCWHLWKNRSSGWLEAILLRANLFMGATLVGLFVVANAPMISFKEVPYRAEIACMFTDPIDLRGKCAANLWLLKWTDFYRRNRDLAKYRLAIFQNPPIMDMLRSYSSESLVIVEAPQVWPHVHIQERFPPDAHIEPGRVMHVMESAAIDAAAVLGSDANFTVSDSDAERQAAIESFVDGSDSVWYIRVEGASMEQFFDSDFGILKHQAAYEDPFQPVATTEYHRLHHMYAFGDAIELNQWRLNNSVNVHACQDVQLTTEWYAVAPVPDIYSMTLVLVDEQGIGITQQDGNPSDVLTKQWDTGWVYQDERSLTIPCDLAPGEYPLLIGLYNFETLEALSITTSDGAPVGDQLYLTTLIVS